MITIVEQVIEVRLVEDVINLDLSETNIELQLLEPVAHDLLYGLSDDDHPQYLNVARHGERHTFVVASDEYVLPSAADAFEISVKNDGAGALLISPVGGELINGEPAIWLRNVGTCLSLRSDGANWHIV